MPDDSASMPHSGVHVTRNEDIARDDQYEPTMEHRFGIGEHCGSHELNIHTAYLEPGASTRAHYHIYSDLGAFVLEGGCTVVTWDKEHKREERSISAGDFVYVPRGVTHKMVNKSADTRFGLVASYNNTGTGEGSGKFHVEDKL